MLKTLIEQLRARIDAKLTERKTHSDAIATVRSACAAEGERAQRDPSAEEAETVRSAEEARSKIDAEVAQLRDQLKSYEAELEADEAAERLAREVHPNGSEQRHSPATIGDEPRTYSAHQDPRGKEFLSDVLRASLGDYHAQSRLQRHDQEERVERGDQLQRASGTGAFAGTIVPQYLTDLYAKMPSTGRHFADICRHHDLPPEGMTVYIPRQTATLDIEDQAAEGDTVVDADYADELIPIPVRTAAGSTSIRRQALDRGIGIEDMTFEDLLRAYDRNLDSGLINKATVGLSAVSAVNSVTYTDASPTAEELYPKFLQAQALQEAGLLDVAEVDYTIMHGRRWAWLQSQLSSKWPMIGQPGIDPRLVGENNGSGYSAGVRGRLPNGQLVVVDNNIATNKGTGTNEDEVYSVASQECHLWEDPNAPFFIRADQPSAKNLTVDLVLYGYYAFNLNRRPQATAKIVGTGLVTPTF